MQVTVKTLRHYETIGLLLPDEVDDWTGYRYYNVEQMQKLNSILNLRSLGFSLEEIKDLYEEDKHTPGVSLLESKIKKCEEELSILIRRKMLLHQMLDSQKRINEMEKYSIQSLPSIIVASHREVIKSYEDLGPLCVNVIGPEMQRLGCKCSPSGYCFTIEHNKEYKPTDIDIEYCEQVEEMGKDSSIIKFRELTAIPSAFCMKHFGPYNRFYASYTEAFKCIEEQGYKVVGQPRTVYVDGAWNQEDPELWLSIIQIPVEKA